MQMIEWWAYLCDVLTFYNERIANQAYLRTADRTASVNRLIARCWVIARAAGDRRLAGTLAALATGSNPFTLPAGFQVQSKPGPGQQPQVFEVQTAVTITPPVGSPGSSAVQGTASLQNPTLETQAPGQSDSTGSVVLAGTSSAVKVGDRVLILPTTPATSISVFAVATVAAVTPGKDPLGNSITTIGLANMTSTLEGDVSQYQLLRSSLSAQPWPYPADPSYVISAPPSSPPSLQVDLASIVRGLQVGDTIVFDGTDGPLPQCGSVIGSTEEVWYANPANYVAGSSDYSGINPAIPPGAPGPAANAPAAVAIAIPHTRITFGWPQSVAASSLTELSTYLVRYGWTVVGNLIDRAAPTVGGPTAGTSGAGGATTASSASGPTLQLSRSATFSPPFPANVLVQDVNGKGAAGIVNNPTSLQLVPPVPFLVPPLQVLFNLLNVTRGKTVANEVLGSGNALAAGQDFVLQKSPVTYLADPSSISGDNYSSTVQVWVNQLQWSEVRSFYGQAPNAQVFVTREDEQGQTHVVFGDGIKGARLPTGVNNVVATYRYGSGSAAPAAGSLTVVLKPLPGLRSIVNPVTVGGGADPDSPADVRQLASQSVLTFGRAISVDDFQTIAAQTPGVRPACQGGGHAFDPISQLPAGITV